MGMFDSFYFAEGVLPDNKVSAGYEFQTKSLSCNLDVFEVMEDGTVVKYPFWEEDYEPRPKPYDEPINEGAYVYSYEFLYDNDLTIMKEMAGMRLYQPGTNEDDPTTS